MADFGYRAAGPDGRMVSGRLEAAGREAALRQLMAQRLTPVDLWQEQGGGPALAAAPAAEPAAPGRARWRLGGEKALGATDVHHLTNELAAMLRAGLPLDRVLKVLLGMSGSAAMTALLEDLLKSIKAGKGLSQALGQHRELFGDFYINMVRSGEASGQLAEVLDGLAEHLERLRALRESVVSALIYPAILVVVALLSVTLMLGFVVPQFKTLFEDMGEALPLPTQILLALADGIGAWGWLLLPLVVLAVLGARALLARPAGRAWRDQRLLRLPVLGDVLRKYELTRFSRSLGTLLKSGVPIVSAVQIAAATLGNVHLRAALAGVEPKIKQGGRMTEALKGSGLFSPLALNMVQLGEETGRLDEMLLELARVNDRDVQAGVKRALTLIEPVLILGLGVVIAAIIISILMGILSVNELAV